MLVVAIFASAGARVHGVGTERFFHVEAAGHRLRAQWIGPGPAPDEPTLVFLHEGLGSIPQWRGFPEDLCRASGFSGLVYERWGYGGSDLLVLPRPKDYLKREAEQTLPDVLAACGIDRPVLIGHSDGGTIALLYAAAFPERAVACIAEAAHVFVEDKAVGEIQGVVGRWEHGELKERLARHHGDNTETMFRGWAETWLSPEFRDWTMIERLPAIVCPVLVIQGEDDEHGTVAQVTAIADGVSGPAETWVIPDCGHSPHIEARAAVCRRMADFIVSAVPAQGAC